MPKVFLHRLQPNSFEEQSRGAREHRRSTLSPYMVPGTLFTQYSSSNHWRSRCRKYSSIDYNLIPLKNSQEEHENIEGARCLHTWCPGPCSPSILAATTGDLDAESIPPSTTT